MSPITQKKKPCFLPKKLKAMSLIEILVVIVIISILMTVGMVYLFPLISKAKSVEAKQQLEHISILEQTYFFEHSKYSINFTDIGYRPEKLTTEDGTANYKIEIIEATTNHFKARATAIADFDGNGIFNVWEIDSDKKLVEVTPD